MASDIFLVTRVSDKSQWAFTKEDDIPEAIGLSYSATDHTIDRLDRLTYVVKVNIEDTVNAEVYTVQRITLLESAVHM